MSKVTYARTIQKARRAAANAASDNPIYKSNIGLTRTLKIYHGQLVDQEFVGADGVIYLKAVPTGGIRIVNLHPTCDSTNYEVAKGYGGNIADEALFLPRPKFKLVTDPETGEVTQVEEVTEVSDTYQSGLSPRRSLAVNKIVIRQKLK